MHGAAVPICTRLSSLVPKAVACLATFPHSRAAATLLTAHQLNGCFDLPILFCAFPFDRNAQSHRKSTSHELKSISSGVVDQLGRISSALIDQGQLQDQNIVLSLSKSLSSLQSKQNGVSTGNTECHPRHLRSRPDIGVAWESCPEWNEGASANAERRVLETILFRVHGFGGS